MSFNAIFRNVRKHGIRGTLQIRRQRIEAQKEKDELAYSIMNGQENVMVQQVGNLFGRSRVATGKAGFSYDVNSQHSVGLTYQLNKMFNPLFSMDGMQTIW